MKAKLLILLVLTVSFFAISCTQDSTSPQHNSIPTPKISPEGAISSEPVQVYISCAIPEVDIRYTVNGTEPTRESSKYSAALTISENCSLKAKAFKAGYISSKTASADFLFRIADPVISPESGVYNAPLQVSISCDTPGSSIRYTTSGAEPNIQSTLYTGSFGVESGCTVKAKAFKTGHLSSNTSSQSYSFTLHTPDITPAGGTFYNNTAIHILSPDAGVIIRYTTNGSEPGEDSSLFAGSLQLAQSCQLKVRAFKAGFIPSETASATFVFSTETPQIIPEGGSFSEAVQVQMGSETEGAQIRYTTDGTEPDQSSTLYRDPFLLDKKCQIRAKAFKPGYIASKSALANFVFEVKKPQISPEGGIYHDAIKVAVACATPGAQIRYTTDGSEPDAASMLYSGALNIAQKTQIKAKGFKTGYNSSKTATANYKFQVHNLQLTPAGGTYYEPQQIQLSCTTPLAVIRYTLDGSEPNEKSLIYHDPFSLFENATLKAKAYRSGFTPSATTTANYLFKVLEAPQILPNGGNYSQAQKVKLSSTDANAQIRYTLDGTEPDESSALYTLPFTLDGNSWLKAKAFMAGYIPSSTAVAKFNFQPAKPTLSPAGGFYPYPVNVSISSVTPGTEIRYTTDGSNPTTTSPLYQHAINLSVNTVLKAAVFKDNWTTSETSSEIYIVHQNDHMQYVQGGSFHNGVANVTLSSFYLAKHEITQLEWHSIFPDTLEIQANKAMTNITWKDAIIYCNRRSSVEGLSPVYSYGSAGYNTASWPSGWYSGQNLRLLQMNINNNGYRLPTDMEWMFAARGGIHSMDYVYSGSNDLGSVAWYNANCSAIADVGEKEPNELGLYDMSGNVWEYCWDYYDNQLPTVDTVNPTGPSTGSTRVLRGGAFNSDATHCTVSRRFYISPNTETNFSGFRVLRRAN